MGLIDSFAGNWWKRKTHDCIPPIASTRLFPSKRARTVDEASWNTRTSSHLWRQSSLTRQKRRQRTLFPSTRQGPWGNNCKVVLVGTQAKRKNPQHFRLDFGWTICLLSESSFAHLLGGNFGSLGSGARIVGFCGYSSGIWNLELRPASIWIS